MESLAPLPQKGKDVPGQNAHQAIARSAQDWLSLWLGVLLSGMGVSGEWLPPPLRDGEAGGREGEREGGGERERHREKERGGGDGEKEGLVLSLFTKQSEPMVIWQNYISGDSYFLPQNSFQAKLSAVGNLSWTFLSLRHSLIFKMPPFSLNLVA